MHPFLEIIGKSGREVRNKLETSQELILLFIYTLSKHERKIEKIYLAEKYKQMQAQKVVFLTEVRNFER